MAGDLRHPEVVDADRPAERTDRARNGGRPLGQRDRADEQSGRPLRGDDGDHLAVGLRFPQFRRHIGAETPGGRHSVRSRTGAAPRRGSTSRSRQGTECGAAIRAAPVRSPSRRRNSSAEMTTTSTRPWTTHAEAARLGADGPPAEPGFGVLQCLMPRRPDSPDHGTRHGTRDRRRPDIGTCRNLPHRRTVRRGRPAHRALLHLDSAARRPAQARDPPPPARSALPWL